MAKDPYKYFRVEAKDIVEQLSRGVLELERGACGKDLIAHLLRLAHTLKGAAHVVKQPDIAHLAHSLEDALVPYKEGQTVARESAGDMLHQVDDIATRLATLGAEQASASVPAAAPALEEIFDAVRVEIGDMDSLLEGIAETSAQLAGVKTRLAVIGEAADRGSVLLNQLSSRGIADGRSASSIAKARVMAEDLMAILKPLQRNFTSEIEQIERELAQVRDDASRVRLIPASAIFAPLRRAVRHTAESLEKEVEFETAGGEHRLDAYVLAAVRDALLQVVRNAVAHGIEDSRERAASGKPRAGKVTLQAQRRGNRVAFICHDDGRGFDVVALRRAAVAGGLISAVEAESLDTDGILRLIVRKGISTSETVTEVSGRGIGLDVLRTIATKLKAEISIYTSARQGTTVEITVPVSLMSLEAVLVQSEGIRASLPLDAVERTLRISNDQVVHNPDSDSLGVDGKMLPFLPLARRLRQQAPQQRNQSRFSSAVIVRSGSESAAIGVDRLLGTATVLLRPIPPFAGVDPIVAGAALDAEGNPQMVLDPAALISAAQSGAVSRQTEPPARIPVVLVVDDSLTTRMLEKSILESAGYKVELATSAEEALQKALQRQYDLFVVDIEMPGMNGFEFIARTRSDAALREVPSILVSSRNSNEDKRRGEEVGARAYIVKNEFDQGHLLQVIRRLVS